MKVLINDQIKIEVDSSEEAVAIVKALSKKTIEPIAREPRAYKRKSIHTPWSKEEVFLIFKNINEEKNRLAKAVELQNHTKKANITMIYRLKALVVENNTKWVSKQQIGWYNEYKLLNN